MNQQANAARGSEKYIQVSPGVNLHITDMGQGRPVVLIPGLPMSDEIFKYTYLALVSRGFRVIGITLRGFGKSDPTGPHDLRTHASDIHEVITSLKLEDVALGGYSFGGVVAAYYAANYPSASLSALMLISANVPKYTRAKDYPYGPSIEEVNSLIAFSQNSLSAMLDVYGPVFGLSESLMPPQMGQWLNRINMQTTQQAMTNGITLLRDTDLRDQLKNIKVPTAIFHGRDDLMVSLAIAQQARQGIQNAELIIFEEGGHWFIFTEAQKFHTEVLRFLHSSKFQQHS